MKSRQHVEFGPSVALWSDGFMIESLLSLLCECAWTLGEGFFFFLHS